MANHNYSQYSNKKNGGKKNHSPEVETKIDEVVETLVEVTDTIVETKVPEVKMVTETVETKEVPKAVVGTVVNCTKLNVRSKPTMTADVVTVINAGEQVTIDVTKSNREWFRVAVDNGTYGYNGYCMKKFVDAKL